MDTTKTNAQYDSVIQECKNEFFKKNDQYGQSWKRYRATTLIEKICIKLERIQTIQVLGTQKVEDSIASEFPAIINYCILAKIKFGLAQHTTDLSAEKLTELYDQAAHEIKTVFKKKNHDYNEAWRRLTNGFMVDEMLVKYDRGIHIIRSESKDNTVMIAMLNEIITDICNYAIFCHIRISEGANPMI